MHALWLVYQLRFIVPVNPWKFRLSSELLYKRNRPQVFMVYRLINHAGFLEEHEKFFSNSPIHSRILIGSRLWSQSCSDDKNWLDFPAFSLTFVYFAVLFCFRCKFSFLEKPFESSLIFLDQSQFLVTHSNQWDCFIFYRQQSTSNAFFLVRQNGQMPASST